MNWREILFASICFGVNGTGQTSQECVFGTWLAAVLVWMAVWLPETRRSLHEACAQLLFIGINTTATALLWKFEQADVAWACSLGASLRLHWGRTTIARCVNTMWILAAISTASTQCACRVSRETVVIGLLWPPLAHTLAQTMKYFIAAL